jgi:preprotein translocase subunit YajC
MLAELARFTHMICLLAQDAGAPPAGAAGEATSPFSSITLPLMLTMVAFYFLFLLPDRRKQKDLEKLLSGLKKNDPVTTVGGICGIVVNISPGSKYVTIRIDESNNTRIKVLRTHISSVGPHDEVEDKEKDKKETK